MKISATIDIKSTPQVVFGWLENPDKAREWMASVSEGEILRETPERVGTTFREVVADEGGSIEMYGLITGFEPDRSIAFHLESKVNVVDVEYEIVEKDEGVHLKYHADIRWKFPMNVISLFIGQKIRQNIMNQLSGELNQLKELCE